MVLVITLVTSIVDRLQEQKTLLDELFEQAPDAVALVNGNDFICKGSEFGFPAPSPKAIARDSVAFLTASCFFIRAELRHCGARQSSFCFSDEPACPVCFGGGHFELERKIGKK
jgi:hypothetical protein